MPRNRAVTILAVLALALTPAIFIGCASDDIEPEPVVHTPLDLDPTEEIQIAEWWTTGKRLLHLYNDGRYALYNSTNRYDTPIERGRWSQGSYAVLWMEPYTTQHQRVRVSIDKANDELRLHVPKVGVLRPIGQPPRVVEDRLVGTWQSPLGELHLNSNLTFEYEAQRAGADAARRLPTRGTWKVSSGSVQLIPDSPAYDMAWLEMKMSNEGMLLESPMGAFQRDVRNRITTETDVDA